VYFDAGRLEEILRAKDAGIVHEDVRERLGGHRCSAARGGLAPGLALGPLDDVCHRREQSQAGQVSDRKGRRLAPGEIEEHAEKLGQDRARQEDGERLAANKLGDLDPGTFQTPASLAGDDVSEIGQRQEMNDAQRPKMRLVDQWRQGGVGLAEARDELEGSVPGERDREQQDGDRDRYETAVDWGCREPAATECEAGEEDGLPGEGIEEPGPLGPRIGREIEQPEERRLGAAKNGWR
jgi:hypothetical protein